MMGLLSENELYQVQRNVNKLASQLRDYLDNLNKVIDSYANDSVAQTFFVSGNFGRQQYDDLIVLKTSLTQFLNHAYSELFPATLNYVNKQLELVQKGED